jgi:hypothetical protein
MGASGELIGERVEDFRLTEMEFVYGLLLQYAQYWRAGRRNSGSGPHTLYTLHTATGSVVEAVIEFFVAQRVHKNLIGFGGATDV